MWYRLNEKNEIEQTCDQEIDGFLYTEEEIVSSFDGQRLLFKHETENEEYKSAEQKYLQEQNLNKLRYRRISLLDAFDKWEKAVLRGREADDETIMSWYRSILDLELTAFEEVPMAIKYYLGGGQNNGTNI